MYMYTFVYLYVYGYVYVCTHMCLNIHKNTYIHMYIYAHIGASLDSIEEMVSSYSCLDGGDSDDKDRHLCLVLRLMCLYSLTTGSIRYSRFDTIRRLIIQTYGYRHMFTLNNLEKAGLLKRKVRSLYIYTFK
jgi:hypothetical protein